MTEYDLIVGFEIHTELKTRTKVFCGCAVEFGAPPNTHVCPVCLGLPGALPVLNREALDLSLRVATALHCEIPDVTSFDRKNYYYPDLPKNYQISQQYACLGRGGHLDVPMPEGEPLRIGIDNIHLEEDAGKLMHPEDATRDVSVVDLNRAGTPLLEIVTNPDLRTLDEAKALMDTMRNLLRYLDVSDCKMQEGSLRFEANISVRPRGETKLGRKVEIKNLNSVRTVLKCIEHEFNRQCDLLDAGETVAQETRLWDEANACTVAMRSKEVANDYRYFPDPDLVPVAITEAWRERIKAELPELAEKKRTRFMLDLKLPEYNASVVTQDREIATYYESAARGLDYDSLRAGEEVPIPDAQPVDYLGTSNTVISEIFGILNTQNQEITDFATRVPPLQLNLLEASHESGVISASAKKKVLGEMYATGEGAKTVIDRLGLVQISDTSEIEALVDQVIAENAQTAEDYRGGKDAAKGRLVGAVMKASRGKANPQVVHELIDKKLRG